MNSSEPSYWERRRIPYNVILTIIVVGWFALSWPHLRPLISLTGLQLFFILAVLSNVCYCGAYLVDIPLQYSSFGTQWLRWRWLLWSVGTLLASVFANYWLADEVYPFVD